MPTSDKQIRFGTKKRKEKIMYSLQNGSSWKMLFSFFFLFYCSEPRFSFKQGPELRENISWLQIKHLSFLHGQAQSLSAWYLVQCQRHNSQLMNICKIKMQSVSQQGKVYCPKKFNLLASWSERQRCWHWSIIYP